MNSSVLVEGLDLSGKTTLVAGLSSLFSEYGVPHRFGNQTLCQHNPVAALAERVAEDLGSSPEEVSCMHLASHCWDMRHYRGHEGLLLQDGCWLRHKAQDRRLGLELPWDRVGGVAFDRVIYLTASVPVRQRRARMRQRRLGEPYLSEDHFVCPDQFLALEHHLQQELAALPGFLLIDTSTLSEKQVLEIAWKHLAGLVSLPLAVGA